jgi:dipeptidyl aminopeptidase/acylaminoacyl peptidase
MLKVSSLLVLSTLLTQPSRSADVIFGRRVYAARGHTYQQIWTVDAHTRKIVQLTNTQRRHNLPVCTPDRKRIWFVSGPFGSIDDTELWWLDRHTHTETLATRIKGGIISLLGGAGSRAFFTAYEGNQPGLYRWDGKLTKISSIDDWPAAVALASDASALAVQTGKAKSVTVIDADGAVGRKLDNCASPAWSHDARKLACVAGARIRLLDLTTGAETAHADFTQRPAPPSIADFSPDGTRLLVETVGANHTSTNPQSDYWVLEVSSGKWEFVGPGQSAVFEPGGGVLLVTPRDLAPVGKAHDWISEILLVDPAKHVQTPLAAGTAYHAMPSRCP